MRKEVVNQLYRKRRCEEMLQDVRGFDITAGADEQRLNWQDVAKVLARHYRCDDCKSRDECPMELLQRRYDGHLRADQS